MHAAPLQAIVYTSKAVGRPSERQLEDLLIRARTFNQAVNVTGALLYDDGQFLQYIEGAPSQTAVVYQRILNSTLHHDIVELHNQPAEKRYFSGFCMAFSRPPCTVLGKVLHETWDRQVDHILAMPSRPVGLEMLLDFWATELHESLLQ